MKDKEFDDIIRGRLEGIMPDYKPESWAQLEAKMDAHAPAGDDREFDTLVSNSLQEYRAPYQPAHWEKLARRLDAERLRPQLAFAKVAELALLAILLLQLPQLLQLPDAPSVPLAQQTPLQLQHPHAWPDEHSFFDEARSAVASQGPVAQTTTNEDLTSKPAASKSAPMHSAITSSSTSRGEEVPLTPTLQKPIIPRTPLPRLNTVELLAVHRQGALSLDLSPAPTGLALSGQVEALPSILAQGMSEFEDLGEVMPVHPQKEKAVVSLGAYGAFNYNRIRTPAGTEAKDGIPEVIRYQSGYGGGFLLGFDWGAWELGTAFGYHAMTYQPRQVVYLEGSVREGLYGAGIRNIQVNSLELGLHARYNVVRQNRWRVYVMAGLGSHVAFEAHYFLADYSAFLPDREDATRPGGGRNEAEDPRTPSQIEEKDLNDGWFGHGTFKENAWLTGRLGIGVEHWLGQNWSLFAQPVYQPYLFSFDKGIGPDGDQIGIFSAQAGIRIRLER